MTRLTDTWIAFLLDAAFIAFHLFGHRVHGGHGGRLKHGFGAWLVLPPLSSSSIPPSGMQLASDPGCSDCRRLRRSPAHHWWTPTLSTVPGTLALSSKREADLNTRKASRSSLCKQWLRPAVMALVCGFAGPLQAQDASNYQVVGSVAAYLGVMPAEIVGGHPQTHPETRMHGGPPLDAHSEHIVIALFDDPFGTRIEDAKVEATISGMGHVAVTPMTLDPMLIAGVVTYGGYITFSGRDTYTIDLRISRPGIPTITQISFVYDHSGT